MQRFHKPEDEKRMVVILDSGEYDAWLTCPVLSLLTCRPAARRDRPAWVLNAIPTARKAAVRFGFNAALTATRRAMNGHVCATPEPVVDPEMPAPSE